MGNANTSDFVESFEEFGLTRAPQAGQYMPIHQFWKKSLIGIPNPVK